MKLEYIVELYNQLSDSDKEKALSIFNNMAKKKESKKCDYNNEIESFLLSTVFKPNKTRRIQHKSVKFS